MTPKVTFFLRQPINSSVESEVLQIPGVYKSKHNSLVFWCADHAAWLVERVFNMYQIAFNVKCEQLASSPTELPKIPGLRESVDGVPILQYMKDYQKVAVLWAYYRDGVLLHLPCGAGKTFVSIILALTRPGNIVVVTKASARLQWVQEIKRFTTENALVLTKKLVEVPPVSKSSCPVYVLDDHGYQGVGVWKSLASLRDKVVHIGDQLGVGGLHDIEVNVKFLGRGKGYSLDRVKEGWWPAPRFTIVGWETLTDHKEMILAMKPSCVIWDESHKLKQPKRFISVPGGFAGRNNISQTASDIARATSRRIALSATPIRDRVRDLWSQLDCIEPYQWGSFGSIQKPGWSGRYCDPVTTAYSQWDTSGSSNLDELAARLTFVRHYIPKEVTHAQLPPVRRVVEYIPVEDQEEISIAERKEFLKELRDAMSSRATLYEIKLAQAAASKGKVVIDQVLEGLENTQKIVVFTGRKKHCEKLHVDILTACGRLAPALRDQAKIWIGHGDYSVEVRYQIQNEFMRHPGPCCLVATDASFGESLNLNDCDLFLCVQLPQTPGQLLQILGRFERHGMKRPVIEKFLIADETLDTGMAQLLLNKLPALEAAVGETSLVGLDKKLRYGEDEDKLEASFFTKITAEIELEE